MGGSATLPASIAVMQSGERALVVLAGVVMSILKRTEEEKGERERKMERRKERGLAGLVTLSLEWTEQEEGRKIIERWREGGEGGQQDNAPIFSVQIVLVSVTISSSATHSLLTRSKSRGFQRASQALLALHTFGSFAGYIQGRASGMRL